MIRGFESHLGLLKANTTGLTHKSKTKVLRKGLTLAVLGPIPKEDTRGAFKSFVFRVHWQNVFRRQLFGFLRKNVIDDDFW